MQKLVEIRYERNDLNFTRNTFRVRAIPWKFTPSTGPAEPSAWSSSATRSTASPRSTPSSGMPERVISHVAIYPASHYVASRDKLNRAILEIEREMEERERWFKEHDKLLEAQRIRQRDV